MKIKLMVVDLELSKRAKRVAAAILVPLLVLGGGAVAYAKVPHTWADGDTLRASDLNGNFADVDGRVSALEAAPQIVVASAVAGQQGALGSDTLYESADLSLTAGTWLVTGFASLSIAVNDDQAGLGLYDQTHGADVEGSVGPIQQISTAGPPLGFGTSHVVTLTGPTTLRLKAFNNGYSTISFYDWTTPSLAPTAALKPHKLKAVRLR